MRDALGYQLLRENTPAAPFTHVKPISLMSKKSKRVLSSILGRSVVPDDVSPTGALLAEVTPTPTSFAIALALSMNAAMPEHDWCETLPAQKGDGALRFNEVIRFVVL